MLDRRSPVHTTRAVYGLGRPVPEVTMPGRPARPNGSQASIARVRVARGASPERPSVAGNDDATGKKNGPRARSSAVERPAHNWLRAGSNPAGPTRNAAL